MERFFNNVKQKKVLVVGDVILDHYIFGSASRISPEAPVPVVELEREEYRLGGAANVAANIVSLGAQVNLFGVMGGDYQDHLSSVLQKHEIPIQTLAVDGKRPTTTKTRVVVNNYQVARIDKENTSQIPHEQRTLLIDSFRSFVKNADAVIVSDYAKGVVSSHLIREIALQCYQKDIPLFFDPKPKNKHEYFIFKSIAFKLPTTTIITPNKHEVYQLVGSSYSDDTSDFMDSVFALMEMCQCYKILVTLGADGVFLFDSEKGIQERLPTISKHVFDVTGAGDSLIAALSLGITCGLGFVEAAKLANIVAGVSVETFGTVAVRNSEVRERVGEK